LKEAESQFLKAIKLEEKIFGANHPTIANRYSNLGSVYKD